MNSLTYGSVCSGIEAATVAWEPLGWKAAWLAEIEPFPSAVLAHHYPAVPNLGDMTSIARRILSGDVVAPDILVGGTPCQAFSVAGARQSLDDARGNLTLRFMELANAIDFVRLRAGKPPVRIVWENVPGVLSTKDNAFGCFLGGLAGEDVELVPPGKRWSNVGCVYGPARAIAWRTLDAQYFGLAQRRRRVFVIASARDGFDPAQVLLEWEGLRRDSSPRRTEGKAAPTIPARSTGGGGLGTDFDCDGGLIAFGGNDTRGPIDVATARNAHGGPHGRLDFESETFVVAFDTTQITSAANRSQPKPGDACHPLAAHAHAPAVAFDCKASGLAGFGVGEVSSTMCAMGHAAGHQNGGGHLAATTAGGVRRLTPTECERLQGFPDGYTLIPWHLGYWHPEKHPKEVIDAVTSKCPDGPRYKALGNSMATNVMAWIGRRIDIHVSVKAHREIL